MFADTGDLKIYYNVSGDGYPLVLLHGGGSDSQTWEDVVPHLALHFKVYRMDLRGFGQTVRQPEPHLSLDLWTSDVRDFMDKVGLGRAALAGWSLGGAIGINFAARYGERVSHLILIGTPGSTVVLNLSGFEERMRLARSGAPMEEVIGKTFEFTKSSMSTHTIEKNSRAVEKAKQALLRNSPSNYAEMVEALSTLDLGSKLNAVTCPTLILVGDADSRTPVAASEELNRGILHSYMKIIQDCGHQYTYEQPEATSRAMVEFLIAFGGGAVPEGVFPDDKIREGADSKITRGDPETLKNIRPQLYHHYVRVDGPRSFIFVSGQLSRDATGNLLGRGDMTEQARQAIRNVRTVLEAAGASLEDIVSVVIYTTDIREFKRISEARMEFFKDKLPTSTIVEVNHLSEPGLLIEIQVIAVL